MAYTWNSSYQPASSSYQGTEDTKFLFVDFLPQVQHKAGIFTEATYETFRSLVDRANEWLRGNKTWKIVTCESVELKSHQNYVNSNKMTYTERCSTNEQSHYVYYIRGLRLWIRKRNEEVERAQQIGYFNLVPTQTESGGVFTSTQYETLDTLIQNFNSRLRTHPLPGRVINIETQEMKESSHRVDPDRSNWRERSDSTKHFVIILRLFYEDMPGELVEIGVADFLPDQISQGDIFTKPVYEPFTNVVKKASVWCSRQHNVRFCNAQSIEIKLKGGSQIDTRRTAHTEHGSRKTRYVRILRLAYTRSLYETQSAIHQLTCKTFVPLEIGSRCLSTIYENLDQTKERVYAWVKATGAYVISAETTRIRRKNGPDSSFASNPTNRDEYWMYVIRLYMDGVYREPPPRMLPPVPTYQEEECCVLL